MHIFDYQEGFEIISWLFITSFSREIILPSYGTQVINKVYKIWSYLKAIDLSLANWQAFFHHRCNVTVMIDTWNNFNCLFNMQILCRSKPLGTKQHCCATSTGGLDVCSIAGVDLSGMLNGCHIVLKAKSVNREHFTMLNFAYIDMQNGAQRNQYLNGRNVYNIGVQSRAFTLPKFQNKFTFHSYTYIYNYFFQQKM